MSGRPSGWLTKRLPVLRRLLPRPAQMQTGPSPGAAVLELTPAGANANLNERGHILMNAAEQIVETDEVGPDAVGPILRSGEIADAVIEAMAEDNPGRTVFVVDRGDYIRVHVDHNCVLRKATVEKHLGRDYELSRLEIDMSSFAGRIRTTCDEYTWYHGS